MVLVEGNRKRLRESRAIVHPGNAGGKEQPPGVATGILDGRKWLAGKFHAATGLAAGVGNHAHGEGERQGAQGFAVGYALPRELIPAPEKTVAASRQSAANCKMESAACCRKPLRWFRRLQTA